MIEREGAGAKQLVAISRCRRRERRAVTATPRAEGAGGTHVSPVTTRNDDIAHRIVAWRHSNM